VQFAAISAPDIVLASSLLSFFVTLRVPLGLPTIIVRTRCSACRSSR